MNRRKFLTAGVALALLGGTARAAGDTRDAVAAQVLATWLRLALELVRHTPTYTPPVASRTLAYIGVAAFEAMASGDTSLRSLRGQLNGLTARPCGGPRL